MARTSGSAHGLTWACRFDAIRKARNWVSSLASPDIPPAIAAPLPPRYSADDILSLINPDIRKPFDMGEVLLRIVDDSRLSVFKPSYGRNLITTWAKITGERQQLQDVYQR